MNKFLSTFLPSIRVQYPIKILNLPYWIYFYRLVPDRLSHTSYFTDERKKVLCRRVYDWYDSWTWLVTV